MNIIYLPRASKFLRNVDERMADKVLHHIDLLQKYSHELEMPLSRSLGRGLFELRTTGDINIRIFYCFHKDQIYLIHAFVKKKRAISAKELRLARSGYKQVVLI